jgi:hypothetical protein
MCRTWGFKTAWPLSSSPSTLKKKKKKNWTKDCVASRRTLAFGIRSSVVWSWRYPCSQCKNVGEDTNNIWHQSPLISFPPIKGDMKKTAYLLCSHVYKFLPCKSLEDCKVSTVSVLSVYHIWKHIKVFFFLFGSIRGLNSGSHLW